PVVAERGQCGLGELTHPGTSWVVPTSKERRAREGEHARRVGRSQLGRRIPRVVFAIPGSPSHPGHAKPRVHHQSAPLRNPPASRGRQLPGMQPLPGRPTMDHAQVPIPEIVMIPTVPVRRLAGLRHGYAFVSRLCDQESSDAVRIRTPRHTLTFLRGAEGSRLFYGGEGVFTRNGAVPKPV